MLDLSKLNRRSKSDDIPGTVEQILDEVCPVCGRLMKKYKACCSNPLGHKGCSCGYKISDPGDRN